MIADTLTLGQLGTTDLVTALKAVAEPTRLRILVLLADGELNVKDLTQVLDQSQPRLSRHLKLMFEAGLVERFREGSWVYFHISQRTLGGGLALRLLQTIDHDDPVIARDKRRVSELKREREATAQEYFQTHAADWDRLRSLHVSEAQVESAMRDMMGDGPFKQFVDLGSGTGRVLTLFSKSFESGLGIDANNTMLSYARSKINAAGNNNIQVRHADLYDLPLSEASADAVAMHQVLHYLSDPSGAIAEAARIVRPGGRLLIVDFAPHDLEFLRESHAHERLGFSRASIEGWLQDTGLTPTAFRDLTPTKADDGKELTVSLWLAERKTDIATEPKRARTQTPHEETA